MFIFEVAKKCNNQLKTNKSGIKMIEIFTSQAKIIQRIDI